VVAASAEALLLEPCAEVVDVLAALAACVAGKDVMETVVGMDVEIASAALG
jgi:hypothetical protein